MLKRNRTRLVAAAIILATPSTALAQLPQPSRPPQPSSQVQQQQSQINQIQAEAITEIEALLSPEQQKQYKSARRRGAGIIEGLNEVQNLSEDQQTDINKITRNTSRRILNLLPSPRR
jgi:flagellar basal body L-ring protein FlgH